MGQRNEGEFRKFLLSIESPRQDYITIVGRLFDARAELAEKDARIERLTAAAQTGLNEMKLWLESDDCGCDGEHVCGRPRLERSIREVESTLTGPPTTKPQASTQTAKLVPVERLPVPPKPTPPPLRVFREGDMPEKADRAS